MLPSSFSPWPEDLKLDKQQDGLFNIHGGYRGCHNFFAPSPLFDSKPGDLMFKESKIIKTPLDREVIENCTLIWDKPMGKLIVISADCADRFLSITGLKNLGTLSDDGIRIVNPETVLYPSRG